MAKKEQENQDKQLDRTRAFGYTKCADQSVIQDTLNASTEQTAVKQSLEEQSLPEDRPEKS
jgi:hypothetical protein